ncbi:recombinase family protein [Candidatus Thiothrix sp. Deng01]|uniref:Recombinase family protein n=1 Tax=Candidatus Thiothrix phosphatis TaxID=3112415 RepID=A0ABU6CRP8_9GAMM|nr:recombinase family protein [Candidatus Thiothrix sp. Deng01]MEB4589515.1 recombinase family protein [Candidatus Thiothrix sp. Deng01]
MKIGYARVSTTGQDYETQLTKLQAEGCEKIFSEKQSGKSADNRAELQRALEFCRDGDVLVITKLDRLARSMGDLWAIVRNLESKGVGFKVLDQAGMDTTTPTGKLMFNILGSIAEFERDLINARTAEGRQAAKAKGVKFGRKEKLTSEQVEALQADVKVGILSMQAIGDKYGIARNSVYRLAGSKDTA